MIPTEPGADATKRILIVEDNDLNMRLLTDVLEAQGYRVAGIGEGGMAVDLARQFRPDLILLDIQLPDISGLEACRRLKQDSATRAIPVVAVTAFAMTGDERRARDSGCDGYVTKPIMLPPFLAMVGQLVGASTPGLPLFPASGAAAD
ncbi:MAG TPA: response regulator [Stellaceae bacterium]|jgi:two-component system cell cycle response regulator DivK|nr:response regulator [Stellaceae bacterium]